MPAHKRDYIPVTHNLKLRAWSKGFRFKTDIRQKRRNVREKKGRTNIWERREAAKKNEIAGPNKNIERKKLTIDLIYLFILNVPVLTA
jgi:hypothetical protein